MHAARHWPLGRPTHSDSSLPTGNESEYRKHLDELYSGGLEDLPTVFGGNDASCDFMNEMGPWKDILPKVHGH